MNTNGVISAASALRYWERRQEIAANNLANVSTDGFKAERVFARMLEGSLPVADTATDRRAGTLRPTGNPLDLAMESGAFFMVETPDGERLSRGGSFQLDGEGRVVDGAGNALLGEGGPIVIPEGGDVQIDRTGAVRVNGAEVDRLRAVTVPQGNDLTHAGGNLFLPDAAQQAAAGEELKVRQGFVEESNVNTVSSMVEMIEIQRSFASVQKVMTTLDQIRQTISTELGRPT